MTDPTPDTGDVAAVPADQQLDTPDPEHYAEPTDLSDVSDDGDVVDVSESSESPESSDEDEQKDAE